jgi:alanine dehydrogenase
MFDGVAKEIKNHAYCVGLTPAGVRKLVQRGKPYWLKKQVARALKQNRDNIFWLL